MWVIGWHQDAEGTERLAEEESRSHSTDLWVVLAAVASLAAVATALQRSGGTDPVAVATVLLSVLSVTLAWAMVNTVFALKYARMYYFDEPDRQGFDFAMDTDPAYSDFAYLAFTIGMAYAPSEAQPTCPRYAQGGAGACSLVLSLRDRPHCRGGQPGDQPRLIGGSALDQRRFARFDNLSGPSHVTGR